MEKIMKYEHLLSAGKIGSLEVKNRCIMAPMSAALAHTDGTVSDELITYLTARADGGIGLILTEYAFVSPDGRSSEHQISVADDGKIEGLKRMADAVHAHGAKIGLQLQHGGRRSIARVTAPSPIVKNKEQDTPYVLSTKEVYELIDNFIAAAVRAKKAGFDLVEVHCAHGYLLNDFVSPSANRRTDEFGGGTTGRAKVVVEIIRGIKKALGEDFPVSVRVSAEDMVSDGNQMCDSAAMAQLYEQAGADLINVSNGMNGVGYGIAPAACKPGYNVAAAERVSESVNIAVSVAGRINEPEFAEGILAAGKVQFVTIGRALFADPEFVNKAAEGREEEIAPCVGCLQRCYSSYGHGDGTFRSCMINPFAMRESRFVIRPAEQPKRIVIVGAGLAGMETAWIAAKRGHHVTILEKNDMPGGQFRIAAMPPHKQLLSRAIVYYSNMCRKYGVEMVYGVEADRETILSYQPDLVILATGGTPLFPRIPGLAEAGALTNQEVLLGKPITGERVLVIGGGLHGAETADHLGEYGYDITIVEMRDGIATEDPEAVRTLLLERLRSHGVKMLTSATVKRVYPDGVEYEHGGEIKELRGFDTLVVAFGSKSYNPLEEKLQNCGAEVMVIGDANHAANAVEAIYTGAVTGLTV